MRATPFPFALIDPLTKLFVDGNDRYAALYEMNSPDLKGTSVLNLYPAELARSLESMLDAFARGTLQATRGRIAFQKRDGKTIELEGWSRRIEGLSKDPLIVTTAVDNRGDDAVPDDRYWVTQAPHVFGLASEPPLSEEDSMVKRVDQLEQHMWRMAQEIRAAGFLPALEETISLGSIGEFSELTARQREIVTRLLGGERVTEIARDMYLSPSTVRNHLTAVFRRFGVHSQLELISLLKNVSGAHE